MRELCLCIQCLSQNNLPAVTMPWLSPTHIKPFVSAGLVNATMNSANMSPSRTSCTTPDVTARGRGGMGDEGKQRRRVCARPVKACVCPCACLRV